VRDYRFAQALADVVSPPRSDFASSSGRATTAEGAEALVCRGAHRLFAPDGRRTLAANSTSIGERHALAKQGRHRLLRGRWGRRPVTRKIRAQYIRCLTHFARSGTLNFAYRPVSFADFFAGLEYAPGAGSYRENVTGSQACGKAAVGRLPRASPESSGYLQLKLAALSGSPEPL
jgi:hypothetical protein